MGSDGRQPLPETLGPYRIIRLLGQGGMGMVYEAVNEAISRRVAIKLLRSEYAHNSQVAQRFFNEARAANLIDHPALVQISEFGELPDGSTYLVMELLKGENLTVRLRRVGALPALAVLRIGCQVAEALSMAHQKGVVHRDLKPENVMLVPDSAVAGGERVKVLDFGIAKLAEGGANHTSTSAIIGTPKYMSPEQARGAGNVDDKTDVYALGIMLFELLVGRPPFEGDSGELIALHLFMPPPPLSKLLPELPQALVQLIERLLDKDKQKRPAMAVVHEELQAQLRQVRDQDFQTSGALPKSVSVSASLQPLQLPIEHSTFDSSASQVSTPQARKRTPFIWVGIAAAALGIGGWMVVRSETGTTEKAATAPPVALSAPDAGSRQADAPPERRHWSIKTTPPAAQVLRASDQQELGQTPWAFDPPSGSGDQDFIVRLKGYQDQTLHFRAAADSDQAVLLERKSDSKKEGRGKGKSASKPGTPAPLFAPKSWMNK